MTSSAGPLLTRGMLSVGCTALVFDNRDDTSQVFMLRMEEIWREKRFCDIIFNVDGEKIAAHRIVLAARSHYFNALFQPRMREGSESVIELKGLMPEYVRLIINYMYTGRITITDKNVESVLWTADYLGLDSVCRACCSFIIDSLTVDSAFGALDLAIAYDQLELKEKVKAYILKNFGPISNRPEYLEWPIDLLEGFLKEEDELTMRDDYGNCLPSHEGELVLVKRILYYVRHDQTNRLSFLPRALRHVRLGVLGEQQIRELKYQLDDIGGANICNEILNNKSENVVHRKSSAFTISLGPTYANGYISGKKNICLNAEGTSPVSGMDISIWGRVPVIGGLQVFFEDGHKEIIGDLSGPIHYKLRLDKGETIIGAQVSSGWHIDRMTFRTDKGRIFRPLCGNGGKERSDEKPIKARGWGYLVGINCELSYTKGHNAPTSISFRWLVYA